MSIHYENYKAFSKGQGFVGSACRPAGGPLATTLRWFACDCAKCKLTLLGKRVANTADHTVGTIEEIFSDRVTILERGAAALRVVMFRELDRDWELAP